MRGLTMDLTIVSPFITTQKKIFTKMDVKYKIPPSFVCL